MGIKSTGLIRLHNNLNPTEIANNKKSIDGLEGNEILRVKIADSGNSKAVIVNAYKNTFSERSLVKLEKLKNIFLHKNFTLHEKLAKGMKKGDLITREELELFLNNTNHTSSNLANNPITTKQKLSQEENTDVQIKTPVSKIDSESSSPKVVAKLNDIDIFKNNLAEAFPFYGEVNNNENRSEMHQSESNKMISKTKSNSIKEEIKNFKNTLQEKIILNKNIQSPELTTNKKVSFEEESITDTQNIKKNINAKEFANDFREIILTKEVTDGIAISTALRTKLIKNKNNLELTISAETMESTILKFKSIVINLLHDKNSILKNLSLEDRNFFSLHYDILPTQMQKDLVKLHPSILENQVLAKEGENDSALIKKINSEELEDFDLVDDLENFFNELEKSAASSQDFKTEIKIQIPKS
jgi:hypothetical protein